MDSCPSHPRWRGMVRGICFHKDSFYHFSKDEFFKIDVDRITSFAKSLKMGTSFLHAWSAGETVKFMRK